MFVDVVGEVVKAGAAVAGGGGHGLFELSYGGEVCEVSCDVCVVVFRVLTCKGLGEVLCDSRDFPCFEG